jgi:hypothetical protein
VSSNGLGGYGGASGAIPVALFAACFPQVALMLFLLGALLTLAFLITKGMAR